MSSGYRQITGFALQIAGAALMFLPGGQGVGIALMSAGAALSYSGQRMAAKQAQEELNRMMSQANLSRVIKGNVRSTSEVNYLVFGEIRIGGLFCAIGHETGGGNRILNMALAHSVSHLGGCEGISDIWIDDSRILLSQLSGDPNAGEVYANVSKYIVGGENLVKIQHYRGTATQAADSVLVAAGIETSAAQRKGISWTRFTLTRPSDASLDEQFRTAFPRGIPTLGVTLKGNRVYDPRLDSTNGGSGTHRYTDALTWAYSRNPALIAATYMIMAKTDGGMGRAPARLNWPSVAAAANICEEVITVQTATYSRTGTTVSITLANHGFQAGTKVTLDFTSGAATDGTYLITGVSANAFIVLDSVSGTTSGNVNINESRYTCDLGLKTSNADELNLQSILDSMLGNCINVDGTYKIYAGAYRSPTFTLDESWLRGEVSVKTLAPLEQLYNAVRIMHQDWNQNYDLVEAPAFTSATYESQDGGNRIWMEQAFAGVNSTYQAQRMGAIVGNRSRAQRVIQIPCNLKAMDVECWENGNINLAELGLSNSIHRVIDWLWDGQGPVLIVQQEASSYYGGAAYALPTTTTPFTLISETPPAPTGVAASAGLDGIDITWTAPLPSQIKQVDVYRSTTVGGTYTKIASSVGFSYHDPITVAGQYFYKLQSRSYYGLTSADSAIVNATIAAITTISNLKLANQAGTSFVGRDAVFEWDNNTPPSNVRFRNYRVRMLDPADSSVLRTVRTTYPNFTYSYEMNLQDALAEGYTASLRSVIIEVAQESIEGLTGTTSQITVTNAAPAIGTATLTGYYDGFEINTTKPSDPDLVGMRVYVSTTNGFTPGAGNIKYDGPFATPLFVGGLAQTTTYYVVYTFYDVFGAASNSTQYTITTLAVPIGDVTAPTVPNSGSGPTLATLLRQSNLVYTGEIKASWTASTDASGKLFYRLRYWTTSSTKKVTVETDQLNYTVFPTEVNVAYTFEVEAVDYYGNESGYTTTTAATVATDSTAPAAPTSPSATAGFSNVLIKWTNPTDSDFLQTNIYRSTSTGFTPGVGNIIGTMRDTSYVDANVTNGTQYFYKLIAVDVAGNLSTASSEVNATPFTIASGNVAGYIAANTITANEIAALTITAAQIAANTITAGKLSVSQLDAISANMGTLTSGTIRGGVIETQAGTASLVRLDSTNGIQAFDSGSVQRVSIKTDGSGYFGGVSAFSWTAAGAVTLANSTLTANTIQTALSGQRITIDSTNGILAYNASSVQTLQIAIDGSGFFGASGDRITWDNSGALRVKSLRSALIGQRSEIRSTDNQMHFYGDRGTSISGTYSRTGTTITVTITAHGLATDDQVNLNFTTGTATIGDYVVTVTDANNFTVTDVTSGSTSGNVTMTYYDDLADIGAQPVSGNTTTLRLGSTNTTRQAVYAVGKAALAVDILTAQTGTGSGTGAIRGQSTVGGSGLIGSGATQGAELFSGTDGFLSAGLIATLPSSPTFGDTSKVHLAFDSNGALWVAPAGSGSKWKPYVGAKAWVNFKGTSQAGTYSQSGTTVTVTFTAHGLSAGMLVNVTVTSGTGVSGTYTITSAAANTFTYTAGTSLTTSGNVTINTAIRDSINVSSVADNGAGDWTVNFTTAMMNANYAFALGTTSDSSAITVAYEETTMSTTQFRFRTTTTSVGADRSINSAVFFASELAGSIAAFADTYNSGSGNAIVPSGAVQVIIEMEGAGGNGGSSNHNAAFTTSYRGGGGGGGSYTTKTIALTPSDWGRSLAYVVGIGGTATNSTVSGTLVNASPSMTANNGANGANATYNVGGGTGGAGGTASGGTTNTTGTNGTAGSVGSGGAGGAGAAPLGGAGGASGVGKQQGFPGTAPGGGGGGGSGGYVSGEPADNLGGAGAAGRVKFSWS